MSHQHSFRHFVLYAPRDREGYRLRTRKVFTYTYDWPEKFYDGWECSCGTQGYGVRG